MSRGKRFYWDACVFITFFEETPGEIEYLEAILDRISRNSSEKIITSTLTQVEVAKIYNSDHVLVSDEDAESTLAKFWADDSVFELVELHPLIARQARHLIREANRRGIGGLRANDAIHLATALYVNADEIHSYEKRWIERFHELVNCPILRPSATGQIPLPSMT